MPTEYDVGTVTVSGSKIICTEWTIENYFCRRQRSDVTWTSPTFEMCNVRWHLLLHPKGPTWPDLVRWVGMFLQYESKPSIHPAAYMMGVKKGDGSPHTFIEGPGNARWHFGSHQLLEHSHLLKESNTIAPDGHVTFFVIVCFSDNESDVLDATSAAPDKSEEASREDNYIVDGMSTLKIGDDDCKDEDVNLDTEGLNILSKDFENLLLNADNADVKIHVKNRRYLAHRIVLSSRSPVFASMFRHDMLEKNLGVVNIVDCEPDAFSQFLLYLYTGKTNRISCDTVLDLYATATKYDVENLRRRCIRYMLRKISVDTFCDAMSLALTYNEEELMQCGTKFFIENTECILPTIRWEIFLKENPVLANELYMKALKRGDTDPKSPDVQ